MIDIENEKYEGVVVNLDGCRYKDCTFERCQMVFTGMEVPDLPGCNVCDCAWMFVGPAGNVVKFLSGLYRADQPGKELVEAIFQAIRTGAQPQSQPESPKGMSKGPVN
jgi:hypothetical protein